jgi:hypothetical protein
MALRRPSTARQYKAGRVTWETLVAREPRLAALLAEIRKIRSRPGFCANELWYGYGDYGHSLKYRLSCLVGWDRRPDPLLGTEDAYDVAYETLYRALPDCRHDSLFC